MKQDIYTYNLTSDEDDLIEEITTASGWCIKSIDYEIQLKWKTFTPTT